MAMSGVRQLSIERTNSVPDEGFVRRSQQLRGKEQRQEQAPDRARTEGSEASTHSAVIIPRDPRMRQAPNGRGEASSGG
jgi:hypothetical protein